MSSPWQAPVPPHPDQPDPTAWSPNGHAPTDGHAPGGAPPGVDPEIHLDGDVGHRERFHPAYMLITMVRSVRGFIVPIAIALFSGSRGEIVWLLIAGAFAALTVISAVANWWMSSYEVTGRSLRLRTGWLSKQERSVAFERIQSIDLQEPPLARLLGVAQLRVETAAGGGANADIVIEAIAVAEASALRNQLLAERAQRTSRPAPANDARPGTAPASAGTVPGDAIPAPGATGAALAATGTSGVSGEVIATLSGRDLLIAGLTSSRIGPAAAILAAFSQFGDDIVGDRVGRVVESSAFSPVQAVLGVVIVGGLIAWALSILGTVITFSGFALRREDDQLVISTGLLDRRRTTIPLHRIQSITVREGLLRQPFGLASIHFVSAGYGGGQQSNDSGVLFPLIRRADVAALLGRAVPAFAADIETARHDGQRLPGRARARYVLPAIASDITGLTIAVAAGYLIPFTEWWWGLAVLLVSSTPWSWLTYRDTRWAWDADDRLIVQGRSIARSVTIIPRRRVQFREISQNWFQRRAGLATIGVRVAGTTFGNSVTIAHLEVTDATAIADHLAIPTASLRRRGRRRPVPAAEPVVAWSGD